MHCRGRHMSYLLKNEQMLQQRYRSLSSVCIYACSYKANLRYLPKYLNYYNHIPLSGM